MKHDDALKTFSKMLDYKFKDIELLRNALVHRSYVNERQGRGLKSNERMPCFRLL